MTQLKEKRKAARYANDCLVTLFFTPRQGRHMNAQLINYSEDGLCFFCDRPMVPGTTIVVRASEESYRNINDNTDCQMRSMGLATIKWCNKNRRQGRPIHEMGAVYHVPY